MPVPHKVFGNEEDKKSVHLLAETIFRAMSGDGQQLPYKEFNFKVFGLPKTYKYTPAFTKNGIKSAKDAGILTRKIKEYEWRRQFQIIFEALLDALRSILQKEDKDLEVHTCKK